MSAPAVAYISPDDLAARWQGRVKVQTLAKWRTLKKGPAYTKMGGRVLYALADVEAFESVNRKVAA